jgi:hypothetical protein
VNPAANKSNANININPETKTARNPKLKYIWASNASMAIKINKKAVKNLKIMFHAFEPINMVINLHREVYRLEKLVPLIMADTLPVPRNTKLVINIAMTKNSKNRGVPYWAISASNVTNRAKIPITATFTAIPKNLEITFHRREKKT